MMAEAPPIKEITKTEATLLVLFIPSVDRMLQPIDQGSWEKAALQVLGECFDGATAFPKGRGVWRDKQQGGRLIFDEPVVIHCYTNKEALDKHVDKLREFLLKLGSETNQGAVGIVLDRTYMEIQFPLKEKNHGEQR
ncbi:MAG: hypothetical protein HY040_14560 [Planctomycetes bacterium]|nr:hypothetical protein [Planctomycetota bacterium]